jgi:hypothetical protein
MPGAALGDIGGVFRRRKMRPATVGMVLGIVGLSVASVTFICGCIVAYAY